MSIPNDEIRITRILARGILGLHEWERRTIQDIHVSVALYTDLRAAGAGDRVEDGLDYSQIVRRVMVHVESSERFTIEALATDIAGICVGTACVQRAEVQVSKPSAERFTQSIAVKIDRTREMLLSSALIGIGSNVEPGRNLKAAIGHLRGIGEVAGVSKVYESDGGGQAGKTFLNAMVRVETCLPAGEIRRMLKRIEMEMGRTKDSKRAGTVPIDLDLCVLGSQVIRARDVSIPHKDILSREYVARGCAELLPEAVHPETGAAFSTIAKGLAGTMKLRERSDVMPATTP